MGDVIEAKANEAGETKAVARAKPKVVPIAEPAGEAASILAIISRAASDPDTNIDKLERLMGMYERLTAGKAKAAFDAALSAMQPEIPVITERGKIEVRKKGADGERTGPVQQSTSYALWEDINEAIGPVLARHGFALSFRTGLAQDGRITVTGILSHRDGHREETMMTLPHDSTGSKNAVQAVGSSTSYGKRYTACALLNITSRGEDDDGKASDAQTVTDEQVREISDLLTSTKSNLVLFLKKIKLESLTEIRADKFDEVVALIKETAARRMARDAETKQ